VTDYAPATASGPTLRPCGDTAWLLDLDDNRLVHRWADAVRGARLPGILEVVPGLTTLLVTLDPDLTSAGALRAALRELEPSPKTERVD
jgi:allophanate hydrolase subunit 1